ncbi:unnamed protein product [Brachionus calyciflorus]|uniref:Uncharacterized protein n=1 Tax=Brachionus calyciflorus TaxID=104777 RepID=A0A813MA73_9BILA|nr:unnamed protein product [Brachionus calyciflorus]
MGKFVKSQMNRFRILFLLALGFFKYLNPVECVKCYYYPNRFNTIRIIALQTECEYCSQERARTPEEACGQKLSSNFQFWIPFIIFGVLLIIFCLTTFILIVKFGIIKLKWLKFGKQTRIPTRTQAPSQIYTVENPNFSLNTSLPDFNSAYFYPKSSLSDSNSYKQTDDNIPPPSYDEIGEIKKQENNDVVKE